MCEFFGSRIEKEKEMERTIEDKDYQLDKLNQQLEMAWEVRESEGGVEGARILSLNHALDAMEADLLASQAKNKELKVKYDEMELQHKEKLKEVQTQCQDLEEQIKDLGECVGTKMSDILKNVVKTVNNFLETWKVNFF